MAIRSLEAYVSTLCDPVTLTFDLWPKIKWMSRTRDKLSCGKFGGDCMVSTVLVLVSDAVKDLKFEDKDKDLKSDDKDSKSEDKDFPRGQQHWFYRADKHTDTQTRMNAILPRLSSAWATTAGKKLIYILVIILQTDVRWGETVMLPLIDGHIGDRMALSISPAVLRNWSRVSFQIGRITAGLCHLVWHTTSVITGCNCIALTDAANRRQKSQLFRFFCA